MFAIYGAYLYFQIVTHPDAYDEVAVQEEQEACELGERRAVSSDVAALMGRVRALEGQVRPGLAPS